MEPLYITQLKTDAQKIIGLMFIDFLPSNRGALFIYDKMDYYTFWMKNTFIPLDIIFMDDNFRINCIIYNTRPFSLNVIDPKIKSQYILEVNSGFATKNNLKPGMKLLLKETNYIPDFQIQDSSEKLLIGLFAFQP